MRAGRSSRRNMADALMNTPDSEQFCTALPKAELHVHLEGSIEPSTVVELAARHGVTLTVEEAAARYAPGDFAQFIESFHVGDVVSARAGRLCADRAALRRIDAEAKRFVRRGHAFDRRHVPAQSGPGREFCRAARRGGAKCPECARVDFRRRAPVGRGAGDGSRADCRRIAVAGHHRLRDRRR